MCGRYRLTAKERYIRDHFGLAEDVEWSPRFNIAPAQQVPTIRQDARDPRRTWAMVRWGLIPSSSWAKDASIGFRTINAQSETAAEKPAFRDAMKWRRCLVPADGFYEWRRLGAKEKQPYSFGLADDSVFVFVGLWEKWRDRTAQQTLETVTILTTSPNTLVAEVDNRMPVILQPENYDQWLDPGVNDPVRVADLLKPFDSRRMRSYPVSDRVNRPENDDEECAREVPSQPIPQTLF
jgi:putative SOS response-associated peptidase YedK